VNKFSLSRCVLVFYTWWVSKEQPKHVVQNNNKKRTSNVRVVAMFVTADLQTIFRIICLSSMKQLRTKCHISSPNDTLVTATGQKKEKLSLTCHILILHSTWTLSQAELQLYLKSGTSISLQYVEISGITWHHLISLRFCRVGINKCRKLKITALGVLQRHIVRTKFGENRSRFSVVKMADTKNAVPHLVVRWNVAWNGAVNV
jgi:hypothetical protein